jgi:hypothetical protein
MNTLSTLLFSAGCILRALWELACYALKFVWAFLLPKALLAGRVVALESQLAVEMSGSGGGKRQRRQFPPFRLLCVALSKVLERWEDLAHLMKPETVKRWHTTAFRLFWRWRPARADHQCPLRCRPSSAESAGRIPYGVLIASEIRCFCWATMRPVPKPSASTW